LRRLLARPGQRREEKVIIVEGPLLIAEAVSAGWEIESEFIAPGVEPVGVGLPQVLGPGVLERISDTESPQGTIAIVRRRADAAPEQLDLVLVAERVQDPGNLGTMMRSAEAAGFDGIVASGGGADPFGPKTVRASAGAIFHLPVLELDTTAIAAAGWRLLGTSSHEGRSYRDVDYSGRVALIVGNEAAGISPETAIDEWIRVEHRGRAESLNVAMAATLICFEAAIQRA